MASNGKIICKKKCPYGGFCFSFCQFRKRYGKDH